MDKFWGVEKDQGWRMKDETGKTQPFWFWFYKDYYLWWLWKNWWLILCVLIEVGWIFGNRQNDAMKKWEGSRRRALKKLLGCYRVFPYLAILPEFILKLFRYVTYSCNHRNTYLNYSGMRCLLPENLSLIFCSEIFL
jgi:hypothetical protein